MAIDLDAIMEEASIALAAMAYLECEALCLQALAAARGAEDWAYYSRILMPLQECRRQRRMTAADGVTRLGSTTLGDDAATWIDENIMGCLVLTRPHTAEQALAAHRKARADNRYVEVLYADCDACDATWQFRSFQGPAVYLPLPAPPADWRDRTLPARRVELVKVGQGLSGAAGPAGKTGKDRESIKPGLTPADWFIDVSEQIGDALLADLTQLEGTIERIEALERCLEAVTDHEILHQRLWDAARQMQLH